MRLFRLVFWLVPCLLLGAPREASAAPVGRDWFVRAGAPAGDGTRERPYGDPWEALAVCEARDRVHVTEGTYTGRLGVASWSIPFDGVELIGGYDLEFRERNPWRRRTRLAFDPASRNAPQAERLTSSRTGVVVDGLFLDMQDQNGYVDDARTGRTERPGESAMRFTGPATVRNCIVLNPGVHALVCPPGSTIDNNLFVNALIWAVVIPATSGDHGRTQAIVSRNTILFAWDLNAPGQGGFGGAGIAARGPASIRDNILAYCENSAIYLPADPAKVSVTGNVFWRNRFANVTCEHAGERAIVTDASMETLEEVGLTAWQGNLVRDPELALDPEWLARAALRPEPPTTPVAPEPPARWGEEKPREIPKGIAPAFNVDRVLPLLDPRGAGPTAGARERPLTVVFAQATAAVGRTYAAATLAGWSRRPESVNGKALEMRVARGGVANVTGLPPQHDPGQIAGVVLHDPDGGDERVTGFYRRGTRVERVCDELRGRYSGSGRPETVYIVRGVAYAVSGFPKSAFFIESIVEQEAATVATDERPKGRDWFVRVGAPGGDGSREKPFRDPYQALERCEAGDAIHLTEGEYVGRLRSGRWRIDMPYVAMLGGYDAEFARRDPWAHPTRLLCPADYKGARGGYTLQGDGDHRGAIVDGLVFDKATNNVYGKDGSLDVGRSDKTEHLWLSQPECVVRNCAFVNGAMGAVLLANGQTAENNVFLNHATQTVEVQSGHSIVACVVRRNTMAFAWDRRPGSGTNGSLLRLKGDARARVEENVFAYADNDAIRLETDPREVVLRGNVFSGNLWSHVRQTQSDLAIDGKNWSQLASLGFHEAAQNVILDPELTIEPSWLALYAHARAPAAGAAPAPGTPPAPPSNPFDDPPPRGETPAPPPAAPGPPSGNPFDGRAAPATASSADPVFAPRYDWRGALALTARNPACVAGARPVPQVVSWAGVARADVLHEYAEVPWSVARVRDAWDAWAGKRGAIRVAIARTDNQYFLPGVTASSHQAFLAASPDGIDGGLPLRCYVLRGTRAERDVKRAKGYVSGRPEELHWIKGMVHADRQLVVERIERVE